MAGKEILDEDMNKLSAEEREALGYDDESEDDEVLDDIADESDNPVNENLEADDADDDEGEDDDSDDEQEAEAAKTDDKAEAKADKPDLTEFDDKEEVKAKPEFTPTFKAEAIENYDERMAEYKTKRDELLAQMEDGELEMGEYIKLDRALEAEETDLKMQKVQNDTLIRQNAHQQVERWNWEQQTFFSEDVNKIYTEDAMLAAAFNQKVQELAREEAEKDSDKTGMWFLREADKAVRKRFNLDGNNTNVENDGDKKPDVKNRKPNLSGVPKTLANLPQVENGEVANDEFAYLDNMDGEAQERELARMAKSDPAKLERYLAA